MVTVCTGHYQYVHCDGAIILTSDGAIKEDSSIMSALPRLLSSTRCGCRYGVVGYAGIYFLPACLVMDWPVIIQEPLLHQTCPQHHSFCYLEVCNAWKSFKVVMFLF